MKDLDPQPLNVGEALGKARRMETLLEQEFATLKRRDLDSLAAIQGVREALTAELTGFVTAAATVDKDASCPLWQEFDHCTLRCRDLHRRNMLLIQRQLEGIRSALDALRDDRTDSVETYDRMGQLAKKTGHRDWVDEA